MGKLLGPRGSSLKKLQEETMTKMAVLGRGSMRNKQQEEELRSSSDPKHAHLREDLHVEITAFASPAEAHARLAFALTEIRKYLIPDSNDQIRQQQMREIQVMKRMTECQRLPGDTEAGNTDTDSGHETDVSGSPNSETTGDSWSPDLLTTCCLTGECHVPALHQGGVREGHPPVIQPNKSMLEHILSLHYLARDRRMVDCTDCSGHYKRKMVDYYCKQSMKKVKELE